MVWWWWCWSLVEWINLNHFVFALSLLFDHSLLHLCDEIQKAHKMGFCVNDSGFIHLAAGLSCGMTGLAAGHAIGIIGDAVSLYITYIHSKPIIQLTDRARCWPLWMLGSPHKPIIKHSVLGRFCSNQEFLCQWYWCSSLQVSYLMTHFATQISAEIAPNDRGAQIPLVAHRQLGGDGCQAQFLQRQWTCLLHTQHTTSSWCWHSLFLTVDLYLGLSWLSF